MNSLEKKKWKSFLIFSVIAILISFIIFLFFQGFSLKALELAITYGFGISIFDFFWVFCVRDANG